MPLPLILAPIIFALPTILWGGNKVLAANATMTSAKSIRDASVSMLENQNGKTHEELDRLGTEELHILQSFDRYSALIEKIQDKPEFKEIQKNSTGLPEYSLDALKDASVGAAVLLGSLAGAGLGAAGGLAASGATTAAVMAFGTASTGTAISALTGAAATNAVLATLGGGTIAAGGGGVALGTAVLGATTLGVGLLIGGAIFAFSGSKLSDKADEAFAQARRIASESDTACRQLDEIYNAAHQFCASLQQVNGMYKNFLRQLTDIIEKKGKINWVHDFTDEDKVVTENTTLLVGLLNHMCKVALLKKGVDGTSNRVNYADINEVNSKIKSCSLKLNNCVCDYSDNYSDKKILEFLEENQHLAHGCCIGSVGEAIGCSYGGTSLKLENLYENGLVSRNRNGQSYSYCINSTGKEYVHIDEDDIKIIEYLKKK